ncbi:MAG: hypothetical protein GX951_04985 [Mollicutes bacterium]|nr:hypothetical protein [Mollicutes bacterium]
MKKFWTTFGIFFGFSIFCFPYLFFILAMIVMTSDSGTKQLSLFHLPDVSQFLFMTLVVFIFTIIPYIVLGVVLMIIKSTRIANFKQTNYSNRIYCFLVFLFLPLIAFIMGDIHLDCTYEGYEHRKTEIRAKEGYVTEFSNIYYITNKYLEMDTIEEMKENSKTDRFVLLDEFRDIVRFIDKTKGRNNLSKEDVYQKLNSSENFVIYEDYERKIIREIINRIYKDEISVDEVKNELNLILESKIKKDNDSYDYDIEELRNTTTFQLVYLNKVANNTDDLEYLEIQAFITRNSLVSFYEYDDDLKETELYIDFARLLSNVKNIETFKSNIQIFSQKYDIDYENKDLLDLIEILDLEYS